MSVSDYTCLHPSSRSMFQGLHNKYSKPRHGQVAESTWTGHPKLVIFADHANKAIQPTSQAAAATQ